MRRYHLIAVDTEASENVDRVVHRLRQRALSATGAIQIVRSQRKDLAGLEIRCTDPASPTYTGDTPE